jgi:uncharacterized membrane protein
MNRIRRRFALPRLEEWKVPGSFQGLGSLLGGYNSHAYGVAADGSVVVVQSDSAPGCQAFRWIAACDSVGLERVTMKRR